MRRWRNTRKRQLLKKRIVDLVILWNQAFDYNLASASKNGSKIVGGSRRRE